MDETPEPPPVPRRWQRRHVVVAAGAIVALGLAIALIAIAREPDPGEDGAAPRDGGAAVSAPALPRLPDGTGIRLTGVVVDGTSAPVPGAVVTAERERGAVEPALATSTTPPADGPFAALPTAGDGRFAIDGLAGGRYRVRVTGPGLLPAELRYVPVPSDEARIVVARRVSVEGRVIGRDGAPIAGATVGLRGEAIAGAIERASDPTGAFAFADLPEGRYQLYAWRGATAARAIRVNRLGAGPFTPLELVLEPAEIITGRVIDRDEGTGIAAAIELRPSGDDQAPRYARTAPDGAFQIDGVPKGTWIADAFSPGFTSPGGVEVVAGGNVVELALIRGAAIEGRVVDVDGKPIANAQVRAVGVVPATSATAPPEYSAAVELDQLRRFSGRMAPAEPVAFANAALGANLVDPDLLPRGELGVMAGPIPPIPPPGAQIARPAVVPASVIAALVGDPPPLAGLDPARASIWTTGADGRYRVRGLPRGKVAVLAVAPGFAEGGSRVIALELGQLVTDVDVILSAGTMLSGTVSDQHGAPIAGAHVHARAERGVPLDAFTDERGGYRLGPLTGTVELTATAYGHAEAHRTLEISLAAGAAPAERREDLMLVAADAMVEGTLDDSGGVAIAGAQLEVVGQGRTAVSTADGTFAIDQLAPGPVKLRVTHPDYPPVELGAVAATRGDKARLRVPLGGAVEGVVIDYLSGNRLGGVAVTGYGPGGLTAEAVTDAEGRWKLGPLRAGRWRIGVEQPGYLASTREADVAAGLAPGATTVRDVRIELAKGAVLGGTVRDARGQRVAGAALTITGDGGLTASGVTDAQGEFRVRDAPTGDVVIEASKGGQVGSTRLTVRATNEILGLSIELGR